MVNQLPQGWKEVKLKDICVLINGRAFKQHELLDSGKYKVLRVGNFFSNNKWYYSDLELDNDKYCDQGDLLFAWSASFGPKIWNDKKTIYHYHIWKVKVNEFVEKKFLYYLLLADSQKIKKSGHGVAMIHITKMDMENRLYTIPTDKDEQDYIVKTLDAVAEMIKLRKETIQLTKDLIPAIFQEMFGDPITNPKGWEMKTFREVLTIKNGKSQKDVENANGIYPIYGSAGEIMGYANDFICNENSVIIGRKGNINSPKLIKTKFWNVDTAFGLEPNKGLNYNYLYVFCLLYDFERHNRAVVIPSLVKSDLLEIKIPFPVLSMQEEFSDRIEQINQNLEVQRKDLDRLQELFDQLLQKAFTGEFTRGEAYGII